MDEWWRLLPPTPAQRLTQAPDHFHRERQEIDDAGGRLTVGDEDAQERHVHVTHPSGHGLR
jgi:hypothetical protein